jgi:hypothetical protein
MYGSIFLLEQPTSPRSSALPSYSNLYLGVPQRHPRPHLFPQGSRRLRSHAARSRSALGAGHGKRAVAEESSLRCYVCFGHGGGALHCLMPGHRNCWAAGDCGVRWRAGQAASPWATTFYSKKYRTIILQCSTSARQSEQSGPFFSCSSTLALQEASMEALLLALLRRIDFSAFAA